MLLIMMCKVGMEVKIVQVRLRLMTNNVFCLWLSLMVVILIMNNILQESLDVEAMRYMFYDFFVYIVVN